VGLSGLVSDVKLTGDGGPHGVLFVWCCFRSSLSDVLLQQQSALPWYDVVCGIDFVTQALGRAAGH
jgi:hypothetical protein